MRLLLILLLSLITPASFAVSDPQWEAHCISSYTQLEVLSNIAVEKLCHARAGGLSEFSILTQSKKQKGKKCNRPIVLLGEDHDQDSKYLNAEAEIIDAFKVRLLAGVSAKEDSRLKQGKETQKADERETLKSRFLRWLNNSGSGIDYAADRGFFVGPNPGYNSHKLVPMLNDHDKKVASGQWAVFIQSFLRAPTQCGFKSLNSKDPEELKSFFASPDNFMNTFGSFVGNKNFPPANINLETSPEDLIDTSKYDCTDFRSKECMSYIQTARNQRFVRNIIKIHENLNCDVPMIVLVGAAHVGPLSKMLSERGFKSTADLTDPKTYNSYGADPAYPDE